MGEFTKGPLGYRPTKYCDWDVVRCDPVEADPRLIAAAPDMYEAIKHALAWFHPDDVFMQSQEAEALKAALNKANPNGEIDG